MATIKRGGSGRSKKPARTTMSRSGSKKREEDRSSSAAPAADRGKVKPIETEEVAKVSPRPLDTDAMPGWTVTVKGSLPDLFASIVLRKGPIAAESKEAAIATFSAQLGALFKKTDVFVPSHCSAEETAKPMAPTLPFDGSKKASSDAAEKDKPQPQPVQSGASNGAPKAVAPAPASVGTASSIGKVTTEPAKRA